MARGAGGSGEIAEFADALRAPPQAQLQIQTLPTRRTRDFLDADAVPIRHHDLTPWQDHPHLGAPSDSSAVPRAVKHH